DSSGDPHFRSRARTRQRYLAIIRRGRAHYYSAAGDNCRRPALSRARQAHVSHHSLARRIHPPRERKRDSRCHAIPARARETCGGAERRCGFCRGALRQTAPGNPQRRGNPVRRQCRFRNADQPLTSTADSHSADPHSVAALRALVVSGLLLALPGGLLPLWAFHIHTNFARAGDYFIAIAAGLAVGAFLTQKWGRHVSTARLLGYSCFVAAAAIVLLAFAAPPAGFAIGFTGLLITAAAAGTLNT